MGSTFTRLVIFRDWSVAGDGDQELGITRLHTSPAGALVWLERTLSGSSLYPGPHGASLRLMCLDTIGGEVREVVSHQQPEFTAEATAPFCGLFNPSLALRCWLGDSVLALSGPQGETLRPTFINLESGEVTNGNTASGHVTTILLSDWPGDGARGPELPRGGDPGRGGGPCGGPEV